MIKMVEGRMMEYWIVPGKIPVLRGEVGKSSNESAAPSNIKINSNSNRRPTRKSRAKRLDYLNGDESPFFQDSDDRA